jgi:uncharacterized protein YodC (DUF2158 family)
MTQMVTEEYLEGMLEGRKWFKQYGMDEAQAHLDSLERTARTFSASSPVGQMLRGERDYWRYKIKNAA